LQTPLFLLTPDLIERERAESTPHQNSRRSRFAFRIEGKDSESFEARSAAYQRLLRELLGVQRRALLELRNEGRISDEVRRRVERDLDFEESRLED
jgi:hypothetical protein